MTSVQQCTDHGKPAFRWGDNGIKYTYDVHDFIAKAMARGRACRHGEPYKRKVKTHTRIR